LRVMQDREVRRVGGHEAFHVDVRVLAATNKNLAEEVAEERFREDLFYRMNVVTLTLPPLRDRRGDVPLLANHAMKKFAHLADGKVKEITRETMEVLVDYPWPGNVRQLESAIERAILLCDSDKITPSDLPAEVVSRKVPTRGGGALQNSTTRPDRFELPTEGINFETFERDLILQAMEKSDWVIAKAAKMLGMSYRTLQYRLDKFGLKKPEGKSPAQSSVE
jgi:transcriptional regulator with GAF, ATPase, and Fis domain